MAQQLTTKDLSDIYDNCESGAKIIVGGGQLYNDEKILTLMAVDECLQALQVTDSPAVAVKSKQGVFWYNLPDQSFGFSPVEQIVLGEADKCDASCDGNPQYRLSFHTVPNKGGYRLGEITNLNSATEYYKFILVKPPGADDIKYEVSNFGIHMKRFKKAGYEVKYLKNYAAVTSEDELQAIYDGCDANTDIIVGGGKSASQIVSLYAKADCKEVFQRTKSLSATRKSQFGNTYWYFTSKAFGFAANPLVTLAEADICDNSCGVSADGSGSNKRLSWHVEQAGGFRLGENINLNSNKGFFKVIFTRKRQPKDIKYDYGISSGLAWSQLIKEGWQVVYN